MAQADLEAASTTTLLFLDLEASTKMAEASGPDYRRSLMLYREIVRSVIVSVGTEQGTEGDSFLITFHRATDAVASAVEIQSRMKERRWPGGLRLKARMGIHSGEVEAVDEGGYTGFAIHQAARVMAAAHGGQILLSGTTKELIRDSLPPKASLKDLGEHRLKDLSRPLRLFQVVHPRIDRGFPPVRALSARRHNLPTERTPFVGRDHVIDQALGLIRDGARLVTLSGPGGVGKTRLAIRIGAEAAEGFEEGVWMADLVSVSAASEVPRAIGEALSVVIHEDADPGEAVLDFLGERSFLLILDNFEHLLQGTAIVSQILEACPGTSIIATSRVPLDLTGEVELVVPPLEVPAQRSPELDSLAQVESVALFCQSAKAAGPGFRLDEDNAELVRRICERLEGWPLAIELAAAQLRYLTLETLDERLDDLGSLGSGPADAPARQRTMRDAIEWSYRLLDDPERLALRSLSVFRGSFGRPQAEDLLGPEAPHRLARLIDHNLVRKVEGDRLSMLEPIRQFAAQEAESQSETPDLRARHAEIYGRRALVLKSRVIGPDAGDTFREMDADHDNLRLAFDWGLEPDGDPEVSVAIAGSLWRFWLIRGFLGEGQSRLAAARDSRPEHPLSLEIELGLANMKARVGDPDAARAGFERASRSDVSFVRTLALEGLASLTGPNVGESTSATEYDVSSLLEEAEESAGGDPFLLAQLRLMRFRKKVGKDPFADSREAVAFARESGDRALLAGVLLELSTFAYRGSPFRRLEVAAVEAVELAREAGDRETVARAMSMIAEASNRSGRRDLALSQMEEALESARELGSPALMVELLARMARLAATKGDLDAAVDLAEEAFHRSEAYFPGSWSDRTVYHPDELAATTLATVVARRDGVISSIRTVKSKRIIRRGRSQQMLFVGAFAGILVEFLAEAALAVAGVWWGAQIISSGPLTPGTSQVVLAWVGVSGLARVRSSGKQPWGLTAVTAASFFVAGRIGLPFLGFIGPLILLLRNWLSHRDPDLRSLDRSRLFFTFVTGAIGLGAAVAWELSGVEAFARVSGAMLGVSLMTAAWGQSGRPWDDPVTWQFERTGYALVKVGIGMLTIFFARPWMTASELNHYGEPILIFLGAFLVSQAMIATKGPARLGGVLLLIGSIGILHFIEPNIGSFALAHNVARPLLGILAAALVWFGISAFFGKASRPTEPSIGIARLTRIPLE